uniref:Homer scaffold protein 2 n=1 Tax=Equus caballus TaxID=9796 RepID=A0A5F5PF70_HORSE
GARRHTALPPLVGRGQDATGATFRLRGQFPGGRGPRRSWRNAEACPASRQGARSDRSRHVRRPAGPLPLDVRRRRGLFRRGRFPLAVRRRRGLFRRLSPPPGGDAAVALRAGASTRRTWCWPLRPARSGAEMPKKAGATNKGKSESKKPETSLPPLGPVAADPKGCVTIAIHAKPGSKQNAVTDVTAEAVSVAIAAPPSEGEANAELCRYLSKVLDLRKSDVVLDKTRMFLRTERLSSAAAADAPLLLWRILIQRSQTD